MNKTPVSILQEMMVKKGTVPNYELIHDGGGTHINTFTYKVTCDSFTATGTGRCKKDAKHEAATAMLTTIATYRNYPQLPASPAESPVTTPLPEPLPKSPRLLANIPFVNTIGALQDLCAENNLQGPEYIPISDIGPPHARIFTIQCVVSNFTEDGEGTTKKQAKHDAAKKMVDRINNLIADKQLTNLNIDYDSEDSSNNDTKLNEAAKSKYCILSKSIKKKINLGIRLSEYHTTMRDSLDSDLRSRTLEEIDNLIPSNLKNSNKLADKLTDELALEKLSKFESLLAEVNINLTLQVAPFIKMKNNPCSSIMQLDMCPPIVQIGAGKTEAEAAFKALLSMIETLKLLWL